MSWIVVLDPSLVRYGESFSFIVYTSNLPSDFGLLALLFEQRGNKNYYNCLDYAACD